MKSFGVKPGMKDLIVWIQDFQKETKNFKVVADWLREMRVQFDEVVASGRAFKEWIDEAAPPIGELIDKLAAWAKEFGVVKGAAVLLTAVLGRALLVAIVGLFKPLVMLTIWIIVAGARMLWMSGVAIVALVKAIVGLTITTFPALVAAVTSVSAALWANPAVLIALAIIAAMAVIAGTAILIYKNWDGIVKYFEDIWKGIKDAFDFEWLDKATRLMVGASGGPAVYRGGATGESPDGREASPHGAATPSLFAPSDAGGGGDGGGGGTSYRGSSKASVTVDFRNMPRGTRTETRADSDTDLEVITGYAMQGAQ